LDDQAGGNSVTYDPFTALSDLGELVAQAYFTARDEVGSDDPVGLVTALLEKTAVDNG
jgi:hypothetical protein